jgi:outer membrane protease
MLSRRLLQEVTTTGRNETSKIPILDWKRATNRTVTRSRSGWEDISKKDLKKRGWKVLE